MADALTSPWRPEPPGDPAAYFTLARSPVSGRLEFPVRVLAGEVEHLQAGHGPAIRLKQLPHVLPAALAYPNHIYAYESQFHKGWCYLAKVAHSVNRHGQRCPPPSGKVFTAFFHGGSNVLSDWGWEPEDPENPATPIQQRGRAARLVWSKE
jgi:hypothetical protein